MKKQAFTLIELLVIVLIIGILAAIALPQYQKAVKNSRLTELSINVSSFTRAIDMYLLANGWPTSVTYFLGDGTGSYAYAGLDIDIPAESRTATNSINKFGSWNLACTSTYCDVCVNTAGGTWNAKWLGQKTICIKKFKDEDNGQWMLGYLGGGTAADENEKLVCQWWAANYGVDRMRSDIKTKCATVGIQ